MQRGRGFVRAAFSFAKFAASGKVQAKKNLGLMQMQYKNVYVAYVSMGANPTTGKVKLDSSDKSDTVSFAANAVSKELGENRADPCGRLRRRFAIYPPEQAPSAHLKQLVKKIGQDKAMEMLKGAPL